MPVRKGKIIQPQIVPEVATRMVNVEGAEYMVANDAMFTFYQRSMGEFTAYFRGLRDEKRIMGCKCTQCGIVRVPPFLTHCPDCEFAPTELVEVDQVGVMNSTPPITYFATSMFADMAPYGRGRVILKGGDTALSVNVFTTTGILVPGIVKKGTEVKIIFRDERIGVASDIFCVPTSELTPAQVAKKGLQESEINWEGVKEPTLPQPSDAEVQSAAKALDEIADTLAEMNRTDRAKADIAGWKRNIQVRTTGGEFGLLIDDGDIQMVREAVSSPDLVIVAADPNVLLDGLAYRGSLTDSVIGGKIWLSKNAEFTTIFKLDRMARSLARTKK
jgi:uncharacterized OB-fold protein